MAALMNRTDDAEFRSRMALAVDISGSISMLAKHAGVSPNGVRKYLTGTEPTRQVLIALADAAGVRRSWLLDGQRPLCEPASEVVKRATKLVEAAWRLSVEAGSTLSLQGFTESVRRQESEADLPAWVHAVLRDALAELGSSSTSAGESPSVLRSDVDPVYLGRLISNVATLVADIVPLLAEKDLAREDIPERAIGLAMMQLCSLLQDGDVPAQIAVSAITLEAFKLSRDVGQVVQQVATGSTPGRAANRRASRVISG